MCPSPHRITGVLQVEQPRLLGELGISLGVGGVGCLPGQDGTAPAVGKVQTRSAQDQAGEPSHGLGLLQLPPEGHAWGSDSSVGASLWTSVGLLTPLH